MVAWNEYKTAARDRGSLALELFVVVTTPASSQDKIKELLPEHLEYQAKQEASGNLVFAGPLSDLSGEEMQGEGMIIYRAESLDAARKFADEDPMHKQGVRQYNIRKWLVNEGSLTIDLKLSAQSIRL